MHASTTFVHRPAQYQFAYDDKRKKEIKKGRGASRTSCMAQMQTRKGYQTMNFRQGGLRVRDDEGSEGKMEKYEGPRKIPWHKAPKG